MKITLLAVGRPGRPMAVPIAFYEARLPHYWRFEAIEVRSGAAGDRDPDAVRAAEGRRILERIPAGAELWALTRGGTPLGSEALADRLGRRALHAAPDMALCVGGAFGLSNEVLERAELRLSISEMTLPHEMARLVLAEQLYRAGTILRGEPYHKGGDG